MARRSDASARPAPADTAAAPKEQTFYPVVLSDGMQPLDGTTEHVAFEVISFDPSGLGVQLVVSEADAQGWERDEADEAAVDKYTASLDARAVLEDDLAEHDDPELLAQSERLIEAECARRASLLGRRSRKLYRERLEAATRWARRKYDANRGEFSVFATTVARLVWRRFIERYPVKNLRAERADEDARMAATKDPRALGAYLIAVRRDVAKWLAWRRRQPREKFLLGALVDDIEERALVAFRQGTWWTYEKPGRAAIWQVRDQVIGDHRRRKRIWLTDLPMEQIHAAIPRPDELLERLQLEEQFTEPLIDELRPRLSRIQCRYLDAMIIELQLGDRLGLAARVAQRLGRDPSQASRAIERIRQVALELGALDRFRLK